MVWTYTAMKPQIDPSLAIEAKAITALAFRNGPIEDLQGTLQETERNVRQGEFS